MALRYYLVSPTLNPTSKGQVINIGEYEVQYGYKKQVNISYEEALEKTKEELIKEGFGVLTEIDVKATLKKKLNVDFDKYIILGTCNPPFAYQALQLEKDIGLLLPCNVIVYESEGNTYISAIVPTVAMSMVENEKLSEVAVQVEKKLTKLIDSI
jgi:uncharacterized protein (DUF302 family)